MLKLRPFSNSLTQVRYLYKRSNVIKSNAQPKIIKHIGEPLITSKRPEFNLHVGDKVIADAPFQSIPLVSDGWHHYKSKNDYFIIHPHQEVEDESQSSEYKQPFDKLNLHPQLIQNLLHRFKIETTTYIQYAAIPAILKKKHTLVAAETGCGKTVAYLLPILQNVLKRREMHKDESTDFNAPEVLIVTPSRELATQIGEVCEDLCHGLDLKTSVLVGGRTKARMMHPNIEEIDILVCSLGALSKLITTKLYRMHKVRHVVLDEADTLLDDSFRSKLAFVMKHFPFYKNASLHHPKEVSTQLVLASATMPTNIAESVEMVIDPSTIAEVVSPSLHRIMPNIRQKFIRMRKSHRPLELLSIAKAQMEKKRPIIVFSNKRPTADYVSIFLNHNGIDCVSLNKDHIEKIRREQFGKFQSGQVNVLSTTDLASRGLDTKRACHVVNFDFPLHISDYIHRCGRVGRESSINNCSVTNFISGQHELELVKKIEHTARTKGILPNVNANINRIITNKIMQQIEKEDRDFMQSL